jgi:class 3 adenylate cyclase
MDVPHPDEAIRWAYTWGQLEARVLSLREHVAGLCPPPGTPLGANFCKLTEFADALYKGVCDARHAPPPTVPPAALRTLRHNLRGHAARVVSGCDELAEDFADRLPPATLAEVRTTRTLAHGVIGQIDSAFRTDGDARGGHGFDAESYRAARRRLAGEPGRILIVDDNADNITHLTRLLTKWGGHAITPTPSGEAALAALGREPFDVVLLDVMMPGGMSGFEVLERIRAHPEWRRVPVILLSALGEEDALIRGIENGADDYVRRPFNPDLLVARISACLDRKRAADRELAYQKRIEELLNALFPPEVVDEVRQHGKYTPRGHEAVGVLFLDVVGFTRYCEAHKDQPGCVVESLQFLVGSLEDVARRHGVQKIKTIGDAFLGTAGLTRPDPTPVDTLVRCGADMMRVVADHPAGWQVRVGIHVGPVIAGVIGATQFQFDVWGDTVNFAARLQALAPPGGVVLSEAARAAATTELPGRPRDAHVHGVGTRTVWDLDPEAIRAQ